MATVTPIRFDNCQYGHIYFVLMAEFRMNFHSKRLVGVIFQDGRHHLYTSPQLPLRRDVCSCFHLIL